MFQPPSLKMQKNLIKHFARLAYFAVVVFFLLSEIAKTLLINITKTYAMKKTLFRCDREQKKYIHSLCILKCAINSVKNIDGFEYGCKFYPKKQTKSLQYIVHIGCLSCELECTFFCVEFRVHSTLFPVKIM